MQAQTTVEIQRQGRPLGFTISATKNAGDPIIISEVTDGGLAAGTGAIHTGDILLGVNGQPTAGKSLSEAIDMVKSAGDNVTLKLTTPLGRQNLSVETQTVRLEKNDEPLGLALTGKEDASGNIFISHLTEGGLASRSGIIQLGDNVVSVNGIFTSGKTLAEVTTMLKEAGNVVELEISKPSRVNNTQIIELKRNGASLGLSIAGKEDGSGITVISEIVKGGLAEKCGLQVGDTLLAVNGQSTSGKSISEATTMVKEAGNIVKMEIMKPQISGKTRDGWMAPPPLLPGCPPGLEYLTMVDQLLVQQQLHLIEVFTDFEAQNKYKITNSLGQQVFFAAEESDVMERQCWGPARGFTMRITDNMGQEVIRMVRESNPCACGLATEGCTSDIAVYAPPNTLIGNVRQQADFHESHFTVEDSTSNVLLRIKGPQVCCQCRMCLVDVDFRILNHSEEEVGIIRKGWSGFMQEAYGANNFGLSFPLDMDVKFKAILLGAAVLLRSRRNFLQDLGSMLGFFVFRTMRPFDAGLFTMKIIVFAFKT